MIIYPSSDSVPKQKRTALEEIIDDMELWEDSLESIRNNY